MFNPFHSNGLSCTVWNCPFRIILANSADPDEMPLNAAFHLGLHCLPNYLYTGNQNEKKFYRDLFNAYVISTSIAWAG